jgi:succinate dehydrogenase/fumarate reductase-like Fe-S protein
MGVTASLIVRRGEAGGVLSLRRYEVPYTPGQSVLDGLRYVRTHLDPGLSFRHSCINANSCKECMIVIDGKVAYACTTRLEPREMILEPLSNKPHLRDLVTEIAPPDERLAHALHPSKS